MKRLLVTGASGLLGRALLPKLPADKYEVFAATSADADLLCETSRRRLIEGFKPDVIIHLAWSQQQGFRESETNLEWLAASLDILRFFHKNGGERFIFAGSSSEYDAEEGMFSEDMGAAKTQYGICKRKFTETLNAYGIRFGLKTVSARYFTVYGENDRHSFGAIPSAINTFLRGEGVLCQSPNTRRDYIYAGDAAAATVKLLESDITGAVNIASGSARTMREVFAVIARETGAENLLRFAEPSGAPDMLAADISRMRDELGYVCETSFDEGIKKTVEWWRNELGL